MGQNGTIQETQPLFYLTVKNVKQSIYVFFFLQFSWFDTISFKFIRKEACLIYLFKSKLDFKSVNKVQALKWSPKSFYCNEDSIDTNHRQTYDGWMFYIPHRIIYDKNKSPRGMGTIPKLWKQTFLFRVVSDFLTGGINGEFSFSLRWSFEELCTFVFASKSGIEDKGLFLISTTGNLISQVRSMV